MPRHEHEFRGVWRCEHNTGFVDISRHVSLCDRGRFVYTCACGAEGYVIPEGAAS